MRRSTGLLLGVAWLAVVLVVSGVTWKVIDTAGSQVMQTGEPVTAVRRAATSSPTGTAGAVRHSPHPHRHVSHLHPTPTSTTAPAQPQPPAGQSVTPPDTGSVEPSTPPPPGAPSSRPRSSPPPTQPNHPEVRSWQGAAGTLTASCRGSRISLGSASPSDGWRVEIGDRGPSRIDADFHSGADDGRETQVVAVCRGGAPTFSFHTDG